MAPLNNGWTGGQYSLFRAAFGGWLCAHFLAVLFGSAQLFRSTGFAADASHRSLFGLLPSPLWISDSHAMIMAMALTGFVAAVAFAIGIIDRAAAVVVCYLLACLFDGTGQTASDSLPFLCWVLLAHSMIRAAPHGSWRGRDRADAGAGWRMPQPIFVASWVALALAYGYDGYLKLGSAAWLDGTALTGLLESRGAASSVLHDMLLAFPGWVLAALTWGALGLELVFAPLALVKRLRPALWTAMLLVHCAVIVLVGTPEHGMGLIVLHLFAFDPAMIRPEGTGDPEVLFYDGRCGVCHGAVRFVISEDPLGRAFRFAAIGSQRYERDVADVARDALPDSLLVRAADGSLLVRSAALVHILRGLGGIWRLLAIAATPIPRAVLDYLYDQFAAVRHRLFVRPDTVCPLVDAEIHARFDA